MENANYEVSQSRSGDDKEYDGIGRVRRICESTGRVAPFSFRALIRETFHHCFYHRKKILSRTSTRRSCRSNVHPSQLGPFSLDRTRSYSNKVGTVCHSISLPNSWRSIWEYLSPQGWIKIFSSIGVTPIESAEWPRSLVYRGWESDQSLT